MNQRSSPRNESSAVADTASGKASGAAAFSGLASFAAACGLLVLIAALAYLPLVPQLGYYHDDWFTVASRVSGVSLSDMHYVDRPMMGKVYETTHRLLGDYPLNWHLFAFAVRCFGAWAFYATVWMVWPRQCRATFAMAALFVVYPGFLMQPNANNYSNHLIALALGMVSLALSILALKAANRVVKVGLLICAALLVLVYPRIYETMIGLEGLRWILFGLVLLRQKKGDLRKTWSGQIRLLLSYGAPFLITSAAFLAWRFLFFNSARQGTDAGVLIAQYSSQPLGMAARILLETGKDYLQTVLLAWIVPFYQSLTGLGPLDLLLAFFLALGGVGVLAGYFRWKKDDLAGGDDTAASDGREMAAAGALAVLLMLLPVTMAGRGVAFSYTLSRYTLQAIAGVAILVVGLTVWLLRPGQRGTVRVPLFASRWRDGWAVAALLALAIATQYGNAAYYRDFWAQQRQFWWQMSWRAPGLAPETVLAGMLPPGYRVAEDFEVWAPADLIYYPHPGMGVNDPIGVMASVLAPETVPQIRNGERVSRNFRQISYTRRLDNTLVTSMSTPDACVHFVDGKQVELPSNADPLVLEVARYSQLRGIKTDGEPAVPPAEVFGKEPAHGWCFYYQKASLARQKGDWPEVIRLGEEAARLGLAPTDVSEWIPFYEAYEHALNQEGAAALAGKIRADASTWNLFCSQFSKNTAGVDPAITALCQ